MLLLGFLAFLLSQEVYSVDSGNSMPTGKSSDFIFFTPQSFLSYWGENPMLECREPLLRIYSKEVDSVLKLNKNITLSGPKVMENLRRVGCDLFDSSQFKYYGLLTTVKGNCVWKQIQLQIKIDLSSYNYCGDPDGKSVALNLHLQNSKSPDSLLLISGIPKDKPTNVPDKFFLPKVLSRDTIIESLDLNDGYLESYKIVRTKYSLPESASNLKSLFVIDTIKTPKGNDTIAISSSLKVVLKTGDTLKLFTDHAHGNSNQAYSAYVGNPYFLDADGNSLWDICFDTFEGKLLFIQFTQNHFNLKYILKEPEINCD
jgi:hypothetical protein